MPGTEFTVRLSTIDEERFGVRTARAYHVTAEDLQDLMDFCLRQGVELLIARCVSTETDAAQAMESKGFLLTDTQIYYVKDLKSGITAPRQSEIVIRPAVPDDTQQVVAIAAESFRGYMGHYHADPRLDRARCDEAYVSWAMRSCLSREVADEVLLAQRKDEPVGFATLRMNSASEGEGVLFAVSPKARRSGVYGELMAAGAEWCMAKGASSMVVSTQITNFAVQKVWIRQGFEPFKALYTFHKWFV